MSSSTTPTTLPYPNDSASSRTSAPNADARCACIRSRRPSYIDIFFRPGQDKHAADLCDRLEAIIEELHNSRDNVILMYINQYPIVNPSAHTRPFSSQRLNMAVGLFLPLGLFFFMRIWRYRLRLRLDLRNIENINNLISQRIIKQGYGQ